MIKEFEQLQVQIHNIAVLNILYKKFWVGIKIYIKDIFKEYCNQRYVICLKKFMRIFIFNFKYVSFSIRENNTLLIFHSNRKQSWPLISMKPLQTNMLMHISHFKINSTRFPTLKYATHKVRCKLSHVNYFVIFHWIKILFFKHNST